VQALPTLIGRLLDEDRVYTQRVLAVGVPSNITKSEAPPHASQVPLGLTSVPRQCIPPKLLPTHTILQDQIRVYVQSVPAKALR